MKKADNITFDKNKFTLLLNLSEESLEISSFVTSRAASEGMVKKNEFHITIFGYSVGEKIKNVVSNNSDVVSKLEDLINSNEWNFELENEFYKIRKSYKTQGVNEIRESTIVMVQVERLSEFIKQVEEIVEIPLESPPTHITLFSKSTLAQNVQSGIGVSSLDEFKKLSPRLITETLPNNSYHTIYLPTRPQPDTIVAIFILKQFGEKLFPGICNAKYNFLQQLDSGETEKSLAEKGILLVDIGKGALDHHNKTLQVTASKLVAQYLSVEDNPALSRLLQFAERDDFYGKGTISTDQLDRAFGLSGLVGALNKKYSSDPSKVIEITLPLIDAYFVEENKRAFDMPKELEEKLKDGRAISFPSSQRGKGLKVIIMETDNTSMAGFLRSKLGGQYDVVALVLPSGHTNILTKPASNLDLRSLSVLIRLHEGESRGETIEDDPKNLSSTGVYGRVTNWYYDNATNSILNGGPNPQGVEPTAISRKNLKTILEDGLSEKLWRP